MGFLAFSSVSMATFGFGMNGSTTTESAIYFPLLLGWEGGRRRKGEGEGGEEGGRGKGKEGGRMKEKGKGTIYPSYFI